MFVGYAKANMSSQKSTKLDTFSITSISSKLPRVKAKTFTNQTKVSELASLEIAGGLPGAFTASPASQMLPVVWYWDFSRLIFWFFFFGASLLVGLFCFAWLQCVVHAEFRQPLRETRGLSRAQVGDVITAVIPLTWSITMLMHASAHSSNFDETTTGTFFTIQILGYQWGWNYYLPLDLLSEWNMMPIEVGHGAWVQPQINQSYDFLLARSRSEYWRRFAAHGEWAAVNGRFSVATATAIFAAPQNTKTTLYAKGAILPQLKVAALPHKQLTFNIKKSNNYVTVSKVNDATLLITQYYRTATQLLPKSNIMSDLLISTNNLNKDNRLRVGYGKQVVRSLTSIQNVSNRLNLIYKWLQPRYGLVIKEWRGHNSAVTKQLLINKLLQNNKQFGVNNLSMFQAPAWLSTNSKFVGAISLANISPRTGTTRTRINSFNYNTLINVKLLNCWWLSNSSHTKINNLNLPITVKNNLKMIVGARLGSSTLIQTWTRSRPNTENSKQLLQSWSALNKDIRAKSVFKANMVSLFFTTNELFLNPLKLKLLENIKLILLKNNTLPFITSRNNYNSHLFNTNNVLGNNWLNLTNASGKPSINLNYILSDNSNFNIEIKHATTFVSENTQHTNLFPKLNWIFNVSLHTKNNLNLINKVINTKTITNYDKQTESFNNNKVLLFNQTLNVLSNMNKLYNSIYIGIIFNKLKFYIILDFLTKVIPIVFIIKIIIINCKTPITELLNLFNSICYIPIKQSLFLISCLSILLHNLLMINFLIQTLTIITRFIIGLIVLRIQLIIILTFNKLLFPIKLLLMLIYLHLYTLANTDMFFYYRLGLFNFIDSYRIEYVYWWLVLITMLMDTSIVIVLTTCKCLIYVLINAIKYTWSEIYKSSKAPVYFILNNSFKFLLLCNKIQIRLFPLNMRGVYRVIRNFIFSCIRNGYRALFTIKLYESVITNLRLDIDLNNYPDYLNKQYYRLSMLDLFINYNNIIITRILYLITKSLYELGQIDIIYVLSNFIKFYNFLLLINKVSFVKSSTYIINKLFSIIGLYFYINQHYYLKYFSPYLYLIAFGKYIIGKFFKSLIYCALMPIYAPVFITIKLRYKQTLTRHFILPTVLLISINELFIVSWSILSLRIRQWILVSQLKRQINARTTLNMNIIYINFVIKFIGANCSLILTQVKQAVIGFYLIKIQFKLFNTIAYIQQISEFTKLQILWNNLISCFVNLSLINIWVIKLEQNNNIFFIRGIWSNFVLFIKDKNKLISNSQTPIIINTNKQFFDFNKTMQLISTNKKTEQSANINHTQPANPTTTINLSNSLDSNVPLLNHNLESIENFEFIPSVEDTGISQHKLVDVIEREQVAARLKSDYQYPNQTVEMLDWRNSWYIEAALETQPTERLYHSMIAKRPQTGLFTNNFSNIENITARDINQLRTTISGLGNTWHQGHYSKSVLANKQLRLGPAILDSEAFTRTHVFANITPQPGLDLDPAFISQKWSKDFTVSRTVDHTQRYRSIWGPLYLPLRVAYSEGVGKHSFRIQGGHEAAFLPSPKRAARVMLSHWGWQRSKTSRKLFSNIRLDNNSNTALGLASNERGPLSNWSILWAQAPSNNRQQSFTNLNDWWISEIKLALARWELLGLRSVNRGTLLNKLYVTRARSWSNNLLLSAILDDTVIKQPTNQRKSQAYLPLTERLGDARRLRVTARFCLPSDTAIHAIFSARDVIHTWNVPLLNVKVDCIPGFSSHRRLLFRWRGFAVGQCAEVCGRYHHQMAIAVDIVSPHLFIRWVAAHMQVSDNTASSERKLAHLPNPRWLATALCAELSTVDKLH